MLAASAYGFSRSRSVGISDLSSQRAQLDGHDLPTTGEELVVVAGPLDVMARVVWRTDAQCGIRFGGVVSHEISMKEETTWTAVAGWYRRSSRRDARCIPFVGTAQARSGKNPGHE